MKLLINYFNYREVKVEFFIFMQIKIVMMPVSLHSHKSHMIINLAVARLISLTGINKYIRQKIFK